MAYFSNVLKPFFQCTVRAPDCHMSDRLPLCIILLHQGIDRCESVMRDHSKSVTIGTLLQLDSKQCMHAMGGGVYD